MSLYHNQINPDALPSQSHGIIDVMPQDYEAEIERTTDGFILVHWIEPGVDEWAIDEIHDHCNDIFSACPMEPGRYIAEAVYTMRYNWRHTAEPASRFRELGAACS